MGLPKGVPESKVSRCTLVAGILLLTLCACTERRREVLSTLKGRCAGTWVVAPEHALAAAAFDPPRDRLVIQWDELQPLGESLVPGKIYARGTLSFGETTCACSLEFRVRRDGDAGGYLRYLSPTTAPFGLGGDSSGFFVDVESDGKLAQDWLLVDYTREGEPAGEAEPWLKYTREP